MISLPITFCAKLHDERSWNNPVDPSGTNYFPPEITSSSQTVINVFPVKTFDFNITATDNEKSITGYFWSLDNGISWKSTGVVPTFSTSWDSTSSGPRKILVYVVDNHNLRSKIDTINIFVHNYKSILPTINDTEVSQSDTFKQKLTVTDSTNYLKYYWDTNLNGWDDSLVATEAMCIASKPEGGTVYVHWTVINGSNYVTNDTFMVYFNKRPFPPVIVSPVKDTIKKFISYDYIHNCGSVLIECTASDPDDKDSALTFTLRYGPKAGVFTDSVVTQNRKIKLSNIKELTMYPFELTVNDHCFNRTTIKGQFIVLPPPPKPEGMKFITCQNSTFSMGLDGKDSTAMPVHQVTLSNDFWIDTTEITTEKFAKILSLTQPQATSARLPVTNITWFDAVLFCNARSKYHHLDTVYKYSTLTGTPGSQCKLENVITDLKVAGYRLPTEAEWEFACRGGTKTLFYWGNDRGISSEYAWTVTPADSKIHEVATLKPNNFELYDMAGNVWEWCNDWYGLYQKSPALDPAGALSGNERVVRGSSSASSSYFTQSGIRSKLRPEAYNAFTGFRTVLPAIP